MSPLPISELTNEIYDVTSHAGAALRAGDTWTMVLGIIVTLLPKIVPKIMPAIVGEDVLRERFDNKDYHEEIEHLFKEKFVENLNVIGNLVKAWGDDTLDLEQFGINSSMIKAKNDLIEGEPDAFRAELLEGIQFLQERIQRSENDHDEITVIANRIWDTAITITTVIRTYMNN